MINLIDIECYVNYFLLGIRDYKTGVKTALEIKPGVDNRKELFKFLQTYNGFWVSFNGIHYDNMVLAYGQKHQWWPKESSSEVCRKLKAFSDSIINDEEGNFDKLKPYKYFGWKFTNIDLYLYWSKGLRQSKKISLKGLGIQLGYPVVQELPFEPSMVLNEDQMSELKNYNLEHDLGILQLLTETFEGKGKVPVGNLGTIQLRDQVVKEYGINAWSMDGPKIASEVLLKDYCKITSKDMQTVRDLRFKRPEIHFGTLLKDLDVEFKLPELKALYAEWCWSKNEFNKTFLTGTKNHPLQVTCGVGGIHSVNNNEIYHSSDTHTIFTDDIAAMYPTNIENWNAFRFPEVLDVYKSFKTKRITETKPGMKQHPKGSPQWTSFFQQDLFYKLILNGVSGLLDMEYSWLFNPEGIMKVRCGGQLILLTLMEKCILNDIDVLSLNTDGLEVMVPNDKIDIYLQAVKETEQKFNVQFEREKYKSIVYSTVNDYIAVLENGQLKKKGLFVTQPELGNGVDFLIIPKLLEQYFTKGIKPEVAIQDVDKYSIFDFCASQKVDKSFTVEWNETKQQRLNRYYVSKGPYLYKCKWVEKVDKQTKLTYNVYTKQHMLKGWGVQIYNGHTDQPLNKYKLDYRFYLSQVNKIISELERHHQIKLS